MEQLYNMIFKRKSFHVFKGIKHLSEAELQEVEQQCRECKPWIDSIKVDFKIVPRTDTSCKRGEYCILLFSEIKDGYLQNIGYIGGQLDLWMAKKNIGACWYGMGKIKPVVCNSLNFVIMIAIEKADESEFRKDYTKSRRKPLKEIWDGEYYKDIAEVLRFTPSACNTQPWFVKSESNLLSIYRVKGKRGIMPADKVVYYNRIDIGIFLLYAEICLKHENMNFTRELYSDTADGDNQALIAAYSMY